MKTIPIDEAQANLRKFGKLCQKEPVTISVDGKAAFELVPCSDDDDDNFIDDLIATNKEFREMLEERVNNPGKGYTTAEMLKMLDERERAEKLKKKKKPVHRSPRKTA